MLIEYRITRYIYVLNQCWFASLWFTTCTLCLPAQGRFWCVFCNIKETDNLMNQLIMQLSTFSMMSEYSQSLYSDLYCHYHLLMFLKQSWPSCQFEYWFYNYTTLWKDACQAFRKYHWFFFSPSFTKLFILFLQQDYNCFIIQFFTHHSRCYFQMMQGGNELRILESNLPYACTR